MNNHFIYIKLSVMMGDFVITKYYSSTAKFLYCPSLCSKTPPSASIQAWVRLGMFWDADLTSLDFRTHWQHTWAPLELQASPLRFPLAYWLKPIFWLIDSVRKLLSLAKEPVAEQNSTSSSFCCSVNFSILNCLGIYGKPSDPTLLEEFLMRNISRVFWESKVLSRMSLNWWKTFSFTLFPSRRNVCSLPQCKRTWFRHLYLKQSKTANSITNRQSYWWAGTYPNEELIENKGSTCRV